MPTKELQLEFKVISDEVAKAFRTKMSIDHTVKGEGDFEVVATSEQEDRHGEIVRVSAWDFSNYMNNPVVLWAHDMYSMPVGAVTDIREENGKIIVKGQFAPTECGQELRALYDAGILRTVSVGFLVKQMEGNVVTKAELLELSFVAIPANTDAVTTAKAFEKLNILLKSNVVEEEEEAKKEPEKEAPKKEDSDTSSKGDNGSIRAVLPKSTDSVTPQNTDVATKVGRVLSAKNIAAMEDAISRIDTLATGLSELSDVLQSVVDSANSDKSYQEEKSELEVLKDGIKLFIKDAQLVDKLNEGIIKGLKGFNLNN